MKIWKTKTTDNYFSKYIRGRDKVCQRCLTTENLTCSHYWIRSHSSTRYDPENCIALCVLCHGKLDGVHNVEYLDLMLQRLGVVKYRKLERKARTFKKRVEAVKECQMWLTNLDKSEEFSTL